MQGIDATLNKCYLPEYQWWLLYSIIKHFTTIGGLLPARVLEAMTSRPARNLSYDSQSVSQPMGICHAYDVTEGSHIDQLYALLRAIWQAILVLRSAIRGRGESKHYRQCIQEMRLQCIRGCTWRLSWQLNKLLLILVWGTFYKYVLYK